jgi:hypothetical protein
MVQSKAYCAIETLFLSIRALLVGAKELYKLFVSAIAFVHELQAEDF